MCNVYICVLFVKSELVWETIFKTDLALNFAVAIVYRCFCSPSLSLPLPPLLKISDISSECLVAFLFSFSLHLFQSFSQKKKKTEDRLQNEKQVRKWIMFLSGTFKSVPSTLSPFPSLFFSLLQSSLFFASFLLHLFFLVCPCHTQWQWVCYPIKLSN